MRVAGTLPSLYPFEETVDALPLLGRPLAERRQAEAEAAGVSDRLTIAAHAFAAEPVLRAFSRAAPRGAPARLVLPDAHPSVALVPGGGAERIEGGWGLDVFLDGPEGLDLAGLRRAARPVTIPGEVPARWLPFPGPAAPRGVHVPDAGDLACHLRSWVHLLWLAPLLVPLELGRRRARCRRGARRPSFIGAGADVHPRALLDGAIVEAGASVGEGAAILDGYVGPGATISDFARVRSSVLEAEAHVLSGARFTRVVSLGRGSLASLGLESVLLGRDVFLTSGVIFWPHELDETITAHDAEGAPFDTGRRVLGGAAGHGAVLGARTIVASGRALPGGCTVVMRREEGVQRVEPAPAGTPLCWDDARLVPVARLAEAGQGPAA